MNAHWKHLSHVLEKGRGLAKTSKSDEEEVLQRYHSFSLRGLVILKIHVPRSNPVSPVLTVHLSVRSILFLLASAVFIGAAT